MKSIDRIKQTPMFKLRFRDFVALKSGRDRFSAMSLSDLRKAVNDEVIAVVTTASANDEAMQSRCFRWVLRGLDADKAIRKVKTDIEVSDNARAARTSGRW